MYIGIFITNLLLLGMLPPPAWRILERACVGIPKYFTMTLELGTSKPKALDAAGVLKQWPNGGLWKGNLGTPKMVKTCICDYWDAWEKILGSWMSLNKSWNLLVWFWMFEFSVKIQVCVLQCTHRISYTHMLFCQFALTLLYVEQKGGSRDRWKSGQWSKQERKIWRENTSYFECQKKTTTTCAFQKLCFLILKHHLIFFSQKLGGFL